MATFPLGNIVATPGALDLLFDHELDVRSLLARHVAGDWGDIDEEDKKANAAALRYGTRILSSYRVGGLEEEAKVWVITEGDRSVTTILLPSEY